MLVGAAVLSMVVGNLAAYPQQDMRRLMAYSGVAHAGYLLVGLAAGTPAGLRAAVFYAIAYAVPSMGVMLIAAEVGDRVDDLRGLVTRRPWMAWVTTVMLLSLVGVPPLAGFLGKLYLFTGAMGAGLAPLVVLAMVMSAVSAGFYFRIVRAMFFERPVTTPLASHAFAAPLDGRRRVHARCRRHRRRVRAAALGDHLRGQVAAASRARAHVGRPLGNLHYIEGPQRRRRRRVCGRLPGPI